MKEILAPESTKKYKANVIGQFPKMRSACRTNVVCVTDKSARSLAPNTYYDSKA